MANYTIKNNTIKNNTIKDQLILFIVMFIIALLLDPMNIMIYSLDDYYLSKPLILSSLYMASTMVWGHQIVHLLQKGIQHFNKHIFFSGLFLSLLFMDVGFCFVGYDCGLCFIFFISLC